MTNGKPDGRPDEARAAMGEAEESRLADLERLTRRVEGLRRSIVSAEGSDDATLAVAEESPELVRNEAVEVRALEVAAVGAFEPLLKADGCPVCADVSNGTFGFLAHWQYLLATDEAARRANCAAGGFCRDHTWALQAVASPRGICAVYPLVTDRYAREVAGVAGLLARVMVERLHEMAPSAATCRLCVFQRQREEAAIRGLAAFLETDAGRAGYGATDGLCLPHLAAILADDVPDEAAALLVDTAARHLSDLSAAMRGYALKFDARRRDLLTREEYDASRRALALLVWGRG